MIVALIHLGRDRRLALGGERLRTFRQEFMRVRREPPRRESLPALAAPDCRIEVTERGRLRVYELYGQTILVDVSNGRRWRFSLGLELMAWLNEDTWP